MRSLSRRRFARLLGLSAGASLLPDRAFAGADADLDPTPLPPTPQSPDDRFWDQVRARYPLPRDFAFMNAANLCPTPLPVLEALERNTRTLDADPSSAVRGRMGRGREASRKLLAEFLGVTPETIVIARNTSEANNFVSSGLQLGAGDEVVVFADNHPSNSAAWLEKARRFGFTVVTVPLADPHPGPEYYVDAFSRAVTERTRLIALTHVTNTVGDRLPVEELCGMARARGVLSLVDGAQTLGVLEVQLDRMRPDFYTGSAHKWLCGPKELGLLYMSPEVGDRLWPSIIGLYPGAVGVSRRLEGMGQRDEAALATLGEAVVFQNGIGRAVIEKRSLELAQALMEGVRKLLGVKVYTHGRAERSAAVVALRPGSLDPRRLASALYEKDKIACALRGGEDRPGIRFSPHIYNTFPEVDRVVAALRKYLASGV
jgi:selenocysteine lyase/cysteine desulfurase